MVISPAGVLMKELCLMGKKKSISIFAFLISWYIFYNNRWAPIDGKSEKESNTYLEFKLSFHPKYVLPKPSLKNYAKVQKAEKEKAEKKEQKKRKKRMSKKEKKLLKAKLKQKRKEDKHIRSRFIFNNRIGEKDEGPKVPETIKNPTINEKPNLENGEVTAVSDNDSDLGRTKLVSCEEEIEEINNSNEESSDEEEYILPPFHASGKFRIITHSTLVVFKLLNTCNLQAYCLSLLLKVLILKF